MEIKNRAEDEHSSMTFFSNRIRAERTSAGLTQQALADILGSSVRTIEDWESGKRTPPEYVQRLLFHYLNTIEL